MQLTRPAVHRPDEHASLTFVCPKCDFVLWDGVAYEQCPTCDLPVDWVDVSRPIWCCPACDEMRNHEVDGVPSCGACRTPMTEISPPQQRLPCAPAPRRERSRWSRALGAIVSHVVAALILVIVLGGPLALVLDPKVGPLALGLVGPILLVPVIVALANLIAMRDSLVSLRDLARDQTTRVIHGLEHATIKLLMAAGWSIVGGQTFRGRFEIYLRDGEHEEPREIRRAAAEAIRRVRAGERGLAYDRRCGTSLLVGIFLFSLATVVTAIVGLAAHLDGVTVLILTGVLIAAISVGHVPLGLLAQRCLTVATDFRRAKVARVVRSMTPCGRYRSYIVHLAVSERGA